jgi:hypothetical protein
MNSKAAVGTQAWPLLLSLPVAALLAAIIGRQDLRPPRLRRPSGGELTTR